MTDDTKTTTTKTVESAPVETTKQNVEVTETPNQRVVKTETEQPAHTDTTIDTTTTTPKP